VYEAATHRRVTLPRVPMGEIRGVQISPSERSMALYVNGSRAPSNLYVLDLGTGALRRLTQNLSPDVDPANLVEAQVVRFPSYDGLAIPSLLYRPLQASAADRAPAALRIHGGPGGQSRVGGRRQLRRLSHARGGDGPPRRVRRGRRLLRDLELGAHDAQHPGVVGVVPQGALCRAGRPQRGGLGAAVPHLAPVPRGRD